MKKCMNAWATPAEIERQDVLVSLENADEFFLSPFEYARFIDDVDCDKIGAYLDIFVDKPVIEVYANERQAICRMVYPTVPEEAVNVSMISDGAEYKIVQVWEILGTNPY